MARNPGKEFAQEIVLQRVVFKYWITSGFWTPQTAQSHIRCSGSKIGISGFEKLPVQRNPLRNFRRPRSVRAEPRRRSKTKTSFFTSTQHSNHSSNYWWMQSA